MKVLYVNHSGQMSGAERTLIDLIGWLPPVVSCVVACPEGQLARALRERHIPVASIPPFTAGLRLRPWQTLRAIAGILRTALSLWQISHRVGADLVHANSIRAGLVATIASRFSRLPTIVYLHDCLPANRLGSLVRRRLGRRASLLLANSLYTASSFKQNRIRCQISVVHSPVDLDRFNPDLYDRASARARLGLDDTGVTLGVIGQITPWKGQDDAIRLLAEIRPRWPSARLLVVGEALFTGPGARYDNLAYRHFLDELARSLGVDDAVDFLGARSDVPQILRALDIALVPSWEEPFGLAVTEAMAMAVPVIASNNGGPVELLRDGEEGFLLAPRQPKRWAEAAERLLREPALRAQIGAQARDRAQSGFNRDRYITALLAIYSQTVSQAR